MKDSTAPSEVTIRGWIRNLNESMKTRLRYTKRLAKSLVTRANTVRLKVRKMGGRARSNFFALNWTLSITEEELDPSIQEENTRLHEEVKSPQSQVVAPSRILRSIQQTPQLPNGQLNITQSAMRDG